MEGPSGWQTYYRIIRRIPRGRIATYAQVAALAGNPRAARHVGYALAALRGARHAIPWQRVLGKRSSRWAAISIRDPMGAAAQRDLLQREGVTVDAADRVSIEEFGWRPRLRRASPAPARPSRSSRRTR